MHGISVRHYLIRHHNHSLALAELHRIKLSQLRSVIIFINHEGHSSITFNQYCRTEYITLERFSQSDLAGGHVNCSRNNQIFSVFLKAGESPFLLSDSSSHVCKILCSRAAEELRTIVYPFVYEAADRLIFGTFRNDIFIQCLHRHAIVEIVQAEFRRDIDSHLIVNDIRQFESQFLGTRISSGRCGRELHLGQSGGRSFIPTEAEDHILGLCRQ